MILLSVIIPTRNRSNMVADLLDSLARQEPCSFEWEVLVVDNGSTDNTAEVVVCKQRELSINIRYVLEPRPGLHEGRHSGANEASGEYLAYLDDDMILVPTWLQGIRMLHERKADAVVGRILPKWDATPSHWLTHMASTGVFGYLGLLDLGEEPLPTKFFFGGNLFIPRKTIFEFGGFHPDGMPQDLLQYRGDGETGLWLKMSEFDMQLWYEPAAVAYHRIPKERMTVEYLCKRAYTQGISKSFTEIRKSHGLYSGELKSDSGRMRKIKNWAARQGILIFMRYCFRFLSKREAVERKVARIEYEMSMSWNRGMAFHQTAVFRDPTLLNYVLRRSFLQNAEVQSFGLPSPSVIPVTPKPSLG